MHASFAVIALLVVSLGAQASRFERLQNEQDNQELQKIPPFKVFDNLYYVGVGYLAAWLVPTSDGLILIDSLEEPYVDHLIDSIRKLGFDPKDIKYLLVTHAHADHFGGAARIQEMFGPRVGMIEGDWEFLAARSPAAAAKVRGPRRDLTFHDGDTLTLGTTTLKFHAMPGHTPGGLSIEQTVYDGGRPYKAFTIGGVTPARGVRPVEQFLAALDRVERIEGIQVNVPNHPWRGDVLQRAERLAQRKPGEPHPFVAPADFAKLLRDLRAEGEERLAEARKTAPPPAQAP
jgi:metallo-beta-lactamase class B